MSSCPIPKSIPRLDPEHVLPLYGPSLEQARAAVSAAVGSLRERDITELSDSEASDAVFDVLSAALAVSLAHGVDLPDQLRQIQSLYEQATTAPHTVLNRFNFEAMKKKDMP